ncbi:MAG TPA: AraC family transcriptional regulator [Blastocatellia bacterium]|nr:AraC family transcriptional regulator [Blastocatellia bacterium]
MRIELAPAPALAGRRLSMTGRPDENKEAAEAMAAIETELFLRPLAELVAILDRDPRLQRTWRLIELNYQNVDLRLGNAAKLARMSKPSLNILLRQTVGLTFHQLLTRYRLFQAVNRMASEDCGLTEVALDAGFGSARTFERNFLKILGTAPRSWKNSSAESKKSSFLSRNPSGFCVLSEPFEEAGSLGPVTGDPML